jgi:hypothetical protein
MLLEVDHETAFAGGLVGPPTPDCIGLAGYREEIEMYII